MQYKLDENRLWGQGEDVDLCVRLTNDHIMLDFNPYAMVQFLKQKNHIYWIHELDETEYYKVRDMLLDKTTYRYTIEGIVPNN